MALGGAAKAAAGGACDVWTTAGRNVEGSATFSIWEQNRGVKKGHYFQIKSKPVQQQLMSHLRGAAGVTVFCYIQS